MSDRFLPSETQRLFFRPWQEDDLSLAQGLWGNASVTQFISRNAWTVDQVRERLSAEMNSFAEYGLQYWPIFLKEGASHVGCCGLRPSALAQAANAEKDIELGFHLLPSFWGRGLATEAARSAVALAFETLDAKALFAGHHPRNEGSRRVLEKLGFRFTRTTYYPPTGLQHLSYRLELDANRPTK